MSIKFECPKCNKQVEAENEHSGMMLECPQCKEEIKVPKPTLKATNDNSPPPLKDEQKDKKKNDLTPKQWIQGCLSFIVLAVIIGVFMGTCSENDLTGGKSSERTNKPVRPKQVMPVNIRQILYDYKNNEIGADNTYKDKYIEVTGYVSSVKKDIMGGLYVTIGTGRQYEIPEIQASFDDSQNAVLSKLQVRQQVTVVGKVTGLMMNVQMKDCVIK
jgi:phage FluMu protein Com